MKTDVRSLLFLGAYARQTFDQVTTAMYCRLLPHLQKSNLLERLNWRALYKHVLLTLNLTNFLKNSVQTYPICGNSTQCPRVSFGIKPSVETDFFFNSAMSGFGSGNRKQLPRTMQRNTKGDHRVKKKKVTQTTKSLSKVTQKQRAGPIKYGLWSPVLI